MPQPSAEASSARRGWRETRSNTGSRSCKRVPDLVQGQRARLIRGILLEKEADGASRLLEVAVARVSLVAGRKNGARRPGVEPRHQLGGARLQGVAVLGRQKFRQHQEPVARIGGAIELHCTTRSMSTRPPVLRRLADPDGTADGGDGGIGISLAGGMHDAERAAGADLRADIRGHPSGRPRVDGVVGMGAATAQRHNGDAEVAGIHADDVARLLGGARP